MPEHQMVSVRGGLFNVELRVAGQGEPLVFLHGGGGFTGWAPFLDDLAEDFRVYAPRHPGYGASTGLEYIDDPADMAIFYLDLFDALGLRSINLLGSSLGGMFAAEIAAIGDRYLKALALQAPAGLRLDDVPAPDSFASSPDEVMRLTFHDPEAAKAMLPPQPTEPGAIERARLEREKLTANGNKFLKPTWDKGLRKRIHRIEAPTLLIWGESDGLVPLPYAHEFKRLIQDCRLVILAKAGHVPSMEQRAEYVRHLREFFTNARRIQQPSQVRSTDKLRRG